MLAVQTLSVFLAAAFLPELAVSRAPALFWNHGSGPFPFLHPNHADHAETVSFWKNEARQILRLDGDVNSRPKALVIISAHNEEQAEEGAVNINNAIDNIPLDKHDNKG